MTRDTCIACGRLTHTLQIFIFQLVNTGLTPLLVALFSVRSQRESQREKEASVAEYDYQLDTAWYELAVAPNPNPHPHPNPNPNSNPNPRPEPEPEPEPRAR